MSNDVKYVTLDERELTQEEAIQFLLSKSTKLEMRLAELSDVVNRLIGRLPPSAEDLINRW